MRHTNNTLAQSDQLSGDGNPYSPVSIADVDRQQPVVEHTMSIRTEAWRGAKFGAKVTGIIMSMIAGTLLLAFVCVAIYMMVVSNGRFAEKLTLWEVVRSLAGGLFAIALMSFYGGVAGAMVMSLAAVFRKGRTAKPLKIDAQSSRSEN